MLYISEVEIPRKNFRIFSGMPLAGEKWIPLKNICGGGCAHFIFVLWPKKKWPGLPSVPLLHQVRSTMMCQYVVRPCVNATCVNWALEREEEKRFLFWWGRWIIVTGSGYDLLSTWIWLHESRPAVLRKLTQHLGKGERGGGKFLTVRPCWRVRLLQMGLVSFPRIYPVKTDEVVKVLGLLRRSNPETPEILVKLKDPHILSTS